MGLSGCYACLKYLVVSINFVFWLAGVLVLGFSIWLLADPAVYVGVTQNENHYYTAVYLLLAVGALMFLVGFLGCCGAYRESPCMLVSFFCFLLIILVAEIAAGVWAVKNGDELNSLVRDTVKKTVQSEYGNSQTRAETFDTIQRGLQCCGINGPSDWADSNYNKKDKSAFESYLSSSTKTIYNIPPSCCKEGISKETCDTITHLGAGASISQQIYSQGCVDRLLQLMNDHKNIVMGVGIGIGVIELLGLIFSLVLCCTIRAIDRYKA